ncbi:MAG: CHASE2 domain-containing protein [Actinomycetota bacterium]|nr:CHASE2 domain-containing protein [Actinomycetota bacterium]
MSHGRAVLVAVVVAALAASGAMATSALDRLEQDSVDLRFTLRPVERPTDVVVVGVDDVSFSVLRKRWPFPRGLHARAIDALRRAGARVIVYDVQFTEPTESGQDEALYAAVGRSRRVVLATTETDGHGHTNVLGGDDNLRRAHAVAAASNLPSDAGGVTRRYSDAVNGLLAIAPVAARAAGHPAGARDFTAGGAWIDFRGPPGTIPTYSFADLVRGHVDPAAFRGKVVVIGATAPTLQDVHPVPTSSDGLMAGPEVQANAIWSAMHGNPLRSGPIWLDLLLIVALAGLPALAGLRARMALVAVATPVAAAAFFGAAQLAFDAGVIVGVVYPIVALLLGAVATIVAGYVTASRERRVISRYSEVLEERVRERTAQLHDTQLEVVQRLAQAAESRDEATGDHIARMTHISWRLALACGLGAQEAEQIRYASALHDIGKIAIPDRILLKPGRLTPEEWEVMKTHAALGAGTLTGSSSGLVQLGEEIALTHHERWDGSGYPGGLRGAQIPLAGRICAVADVFDALLSRRPYKEPWTLEKTLAQIRSDAGSHFDPRVVEMFIPLGAEIYDALGYTGERSAPAPEAGAELAPAAV